jgi:uncharacterized protein YunC (DUF1805 family)
MDEKLLEVVRIRLAAGIAEGVAISLIEAPLLIIRAKNGFIMCGLLDVEALDKLLPGKIAAAKVSGVSTFEELLNKKVVAATLKAGALGVDENVSGREALERMM